MHVDSASSPGNIASSRLVAPGSPRMGCYRLTKKLKNQNLYAVSLLNNVNGNKHVWHVTNWINEEISEMAVPLRIQSVSLIFWCLQNFIANFFLSYEELGNWLGIWSVLCSKMLQRYICLGAVQDQNPKLYIAGWMPTKSSEIRMQ